MESVTTFFLLIGVLVLLGLLGLVLWVWLLIRVGRSSIAGAVLTFLFWPVSLYFLIKYWDDEELNVRAPFFGNIAVFALSVLLVIPIMKIGGTSALKAQRQKETENVKSNASMER